MLEGLFKNKKQEEADEGDQVLILDILDEERTMLPPGFEIVSTTQDGKIIAKDREGHLWVIK
ncbi:hypothetical protein ATV_gp14 [Bicaudavirus pozzuoliense]|uniref:Uncharacterized protein ORF61 n=2 Tax=Acidianus two-tailed virus TaxID=315953 RepID=Y061_ATV|nr:hypothetical protein ATV_gp14 [Acidianus two-tailed virus]Q3V4W7.1 RecName: Full=Uncharacterized protein ORF61 [Acidianus two-tailed virus]AON96493.1 hypothetical protein [Acidianus two-tailed phage variant 1]CAI59847.1 hypothetical protein [Acidianus two-tailed virus]